MCSKKAIQQSCKLSTFRDWLLSAAAKKFMPVFPAIILMFF